MAKIENTLECLELLMDTMHKKNISKLEYSCEEFELTLETPNQTVAVVAQPAPAVSQTAAQPAASASAASGNIVKSPIVGTYYSAPAPDKPPFVTVGQKVKKGDVLMIIESMKLMNEIQSDYDGTVAEILVADGTAVEFDQPLMRIE